MSEDTIARLLSGALGAIICLALLAGVWRIWNRDEYLGGRRAQLARCRWAASRRRAARRAARLVGPVKPVVVFYGRLPDHGALEYDPRRVELVVRPWTNAPRAATAPTAPTAPTNPTTATTAATCTAAVAAYAVGQLIATVWRVKHGRLPLATEVHEAQKAVTGPLRAARERAGTAGQKLELSEQETRELVLNAARWAAAELAPRALGEERAA
jgi:hypothetical protein